MTESIPTYGFPEKSSHKATQGAVRATYYWNGDRYTILVVEDGKHYFAATDTLEWAEALVRLVKR